MDDIRRPQQPQRRDYTTPTPQRRPEPAAQQPSNAPLPSNQVSPATPPSYNSPSLYQAPPQNSYDQPSIPISQPQYQPPQPQYQSSTTPQPEPEPQFYRPGPYNPQSQPPQPQPKGEAKKTKKSPVLKILTAMVVLVTGASLVYFGYFLKSSTSGNSIPPKIVQQAGFPVYFPSPMPNGYTYMKDTATFQIGQVFYKFANGSKRVTVNEQPLPEQPPKLDLPGYQQFNATVGKATVGATYGVSSAEVIAGKTLISLNSSGGVTQDELKAAINSLKNIGLSSDNKQ
jgi:hypothetical protein